MSFRLAARIASPEPALRANGWSHSRAPADRHPSRINSETPSCSRDRSRHRGTATSPRHHQGRSLPAPRLSCSGHSRATSRCSRPGRSGVRSSLRPSGRERVSCPDDVPLIPSIRLEESRARNPAALNRIAQAHSPERDDSNLRRAKGPQGPLGRLERDRTGHRRKLIALLGGEPLVEVAELFWLGRGSGVSCPSSAYPSTGAEAGLNLTANSLAQAAIASQSRMSETGSLFMAGSRL